MRKAESIRDGSLPSTVTSRGGVSIRAPAFGNWGLSGSSFKNEQLVIGVALALARALASALAATP